MFQAVRFADKMTPSFFLCLLSFKVDDRPA